MAGGDRRIFQSLRDILALHAIVPSTILAVLSYIASLFQRRRSTFDPDVDIPSLNGKVVFVTGGNAGLGFETVLQIAKHGPAKVWIASRNVPKMHDAIAKISMLVPSTAIEALEMDLMSFQSIVDAARVFQDRSSRLDLLFLNAGIMATPLATTHEGYEAQFGTNYMGHALLTRLLLPLMLETARIPKADVRIMELSSIGHHMAPAEGILLHQDELMKHNHWVLYGHSKLANILHVKALAKRYPNICSISIHPGLIKTDLYNPSSAAWWPLRIGMTLFAPLFFMPASRGVYTQLYAASTARGVLSNGAYLIPVGKETGQSKLANDEQLADTLWDWTQEQFSKHGIPRSGSTV